MSKKLLLALAACLPLALAGCGGGGGTPAASTQTPAASTQTPAAALTAAENAVAAANSAKTAAAVEAARRALDAAVETASAAVEAVEADSAALRTVEADVQTYQTQQTAILDGLQPITPASLATVKPAATLQLRITWRSGRLTPLDYLLHLGAADRHNAAVAAAEKAMARARAERTPVRIDEARRAVRAIERSVIGVREAVDAALETTRTAFTRARNYRTEQTPLIAAIQTQPEQRGGGRVATWSQSRVADLNVTHVQMTDIRSPDGSRTEVVCSDSVTNGFACSQVLAADVAAIAGRSRIPMRVAGVHVAPLQGASDLTNGFSALVSGGAINDVRVAIKGPVTTDGGDRYNIGGVGQYSAFSTEWFDEQTLGWSSASSTAFGERAARRPLGSGTWRGAMVGTSISDSGPALAGRAALTFSLADNEIDVQISSVRSYNAVSYTGPSSFSWSNLRVQSDGRFHRDGSGNDHITGNFYGPETTETAGVFEQGSVIGAWLAIAPEILDADN